MAICALWTHWPMGVRLMGGVAHARTKTGMDVLPFFYRITSRRPERSLRSPVRVWPTRIKTARPRGPRPRMLDFL